jgi:hypothetical protein
MRKDKTNGGSAPPTNGDRYAVVLGVEAWKRLKENGRKCWNDWKLIGAALLVGSEEAVAKTGSQPGKKKYNEYFGNWCQTRGFGEIDKDDRSKLLRIMRDLEEIEAWRKSLKPGQRACWNAPSTVWRISRCDKRGLPRFRKLEGGDKQAKKGDGAESDTQEKWEGRLYILACKVVGAAEDLKRLELSGSPEPGLVEQVRDGAQAWAKILEALEALGRPTVEEVSKSEDATEVVASDAADAAEDGADAEDKATQGDADEIIRVAA